MSAISEAAKIFLTRRVVIDHEVVTYRVLSRELAIHVNDAKKWLEDFLDQSKHSDAPVHATYLVSGEDLPTPIKDVSMNPVESEEGGAFGGSLSSTAVPSVPTWQILLTPADDLEQCKGRFARISSVHVYSLSPETVKNPTLLVTTATIVRQKDSAASNPPMHAKAVGTTLNPHWNSQAILATPKAKTAKSMPPPPAVPTPAAKPLAGPSGKPAARPSDARNGSGTARLKKRVLVSDTEEEEDDTRPSASIAPTSKKPRSRMGNPVALNLSDGGGVVSVMNQKTLVASAKPTKGDRVVLQSDDEEEGSQFSASESEPEHVPLSAAEARRTLKGPKKEKEMDIDALARKEKREWGKTAKGLGGGRIPKGKRKVQKERTFVNERGRTVTEDYWTLESASDHEDFDAGGDSKSARAAPQSKHATSDVVKTTSRGSASAKPVAKSVPSLKGKKSGQQTLAGFFKK